MTRFLPTKIEAGEHMQAADIQNLTFFPKGTILMYDGQLWDRTGGIPGWHICDGRDGTINLVDKFIRGSTMARQTGGADNQRLVNTNQLPLHTHDAHSGEFTIADAYHDTPTNQRCLSAVFATDGVFSGMKKYKNNVQGWVAGSAVTTNPLDTVKLDARHASVGKETPDTFDNRPAFCSVIFIEKLTGYLA